MGGGRSAQHNAGPGKSGTRVARGLVYQAVSHAARPARLRVFSLSLMRLSQTHKIIMRQVPCNAIPPTCQLPVSEKSSVNTDMHNRVRMVVGSFLPKNLGIH